MLPYTLLTTCTTVQACARQSKCVHALTQGNCYRHIMYLCLIQCLASVWGHYLISRDKECISETVQGLDVCWLQVHCLLVALYGPTADSRNCVHEEIHMHTCCNTLQYSVSSITRYCPLTAAEQGRQELVHSLTKCMCVHVWATVQGLTQNSIGTRPICVCVCVGGGGGGGGGGGRERECGRPLSALSVHGC